MPENLIESALAQYSTTDAAIAELAERYAPLVIEGVSDKDGWKTVHAARMDVKGKRVDVEKTRKFLKADALEYGRRVDGEAKRLTALLSPIEERLEGEENRIASEKARLKEEAWKAKQAVTQARIDALTAVGAAANLIQVQTWSAEAFKEVLAKATAEHAEAQRVQAQREAEEKEKRAALEREQAAAAEDRARLDAERKTFEAEKERAGAAERDRQAAAKAVEDGLAQMKRDQAEALRLADEAEAHAAELERLRPQREKIGRYAAALLATEIPEVDCAPRIRAIVVEAVEKLQALTVPEVEAA